MNYCKKHSQSHLPTNSEIISNAPDDKVIRDRIRDFLRLKRVRSLSGVIVVAVMTSPAACPHGKCTYCPGGVDNSSPQSYTGKEPAALRGAHSSFDPYDQTVSRLGQLDAIGHPIDKVELIIMGGTFPSRQLEYQEWFVKRCLDAMNGRDGKDLKDAQDINMKSKSRCVGMTLETRPDWCKENHVDHMLDLGTTRVELGVQTIYDEILQNVSRGHSIQDVIDATRIAKDSGIKVCYHMMPGLPGMTFERDLEAFQNLWDNPDFRPDMMKIYPTLVIKGTKLYDQWKDGSYEPYTTDQAADLIAKIKRTVPRWVRVQRIQRDIPAQLIEAGVNKSHLRMMVKDRMSESKTRCECIRCREIGLALKAEDNYETDIRFSQAEYDASGGKEFFISFDDSDLDLLVAYARLRFPSGKAHRKEIDGKTSVLRELKVFGEMVEIDNDANGANEWQHKGYGKKLLDECERISRENGFSRIIVNSGIGAKPYYEKFGYEYSSIYMIKELS